MALEAIDHVDLAVSSLERSVPFYEGLLRPLGYVGSGEIAGERSERVVYLSRHDSDGWARGTGAEIESGPCEYDYTPGYYALFVHDPDGIKLEFVHRPEERDLVLRVAALEARLAELEG
jgi:glyoxylase I family protein